MKMEKIIEDRPMAYDPVTNEIRFDFFENLISEGKYYTPKRMEEFVKRDSIQPYFPVAIAESQQILLNEIFAIFQKHKTNYKIIVSPLYNQIKLNNNDLEYLNNLFGSENVFDFSGINKFTNDYHNFYESSHYRPHVSREIMTIIYEKGDFQDKIK